MAEDFANAYKSLPWAAVFSSPLRRAVATAKPLCEAAGIRMQLKEGLREIAFGQWEGKTPEAINREFHDDYVRWLTAGMEWSHRRAKRHRYRSAQFTCA
jgi:probable phosphoglycerate mutase